MSLNNIELSNDLVALLYGTSLIDCNSGESKKTEIFGPGILILTNLKKSPPGAEENLLSGMMKACRIDPDGYRVMALDKENVSSLSEINNSNPSAGILAFGDKDDLQAAGLKVAHFQIAELNRMRLMTAPGLQDIESSKEIKMTVWENLKKFFKI